MAKKVKEKESGHINDNNSLEIQMLLHDHAQASEDAGYRDSLLLHGFYFSLAVFAGLAAAIVRIPCHPLAAFVSFVSVIIFLIFTISLSKLVASRNSAWNRRKYIEEKTQLRDKVQINKWINDGLDENGEPRDRSWCERSWCEKRSVACWIKGFEIFAIAFWTLAFICFVGCCFTQFQICTWFPLVLGIR